MTDSRVELPAFGVSGSDTEPLTPTAARRVHLAALAGLAGVAIGFVAWALALSDPDPGSGQWTAASSVGLLAMLGQTIMVTGMVATRETGRGHSGRGFLALWALGLIVVMAGGITALVTKDQDVILFPVGGLTAGLAALVASVFIACNRTLHGLRRWAPLIYTLGGIVTFFFQGERHTLQVNLADLANNLLITLVAVSFYLGQRRPQSSI